MGLLKDALRTLRVAKKPHARAYTFSLRIVVLGMTLLGCIGYIFQMVGATLRVVAIAPPPRDVLVVVLAAVTAVVLGVALYLYRRSS